MTKKTGVWEPLAYTLFICLWYAYEHGQGIIYDKW